MPLKAVFRTHTRTACLEFESKRTTKSSHKTQTKAGEAKALLPSGQDPVEAAAPRSMPQTLGGIAGLGRNKGIPEMGCVRAVCPAPACDGRAASRWGWQGASERPWDPTARTRLPGRGSQERRRVPPLAVRVRTKRGRPAP